MLEGDNMIKNNKVILIPILFVLLMYLYGFLSIGGGKITKSPDGQIDAHLFSQRCINPLSSSFLKIYGKAELLDNKGKRLIIIRLEPIMGPDPMAYRGKDVDIKWNQDSNQVTFVVPEGAFTINAYNFKKH
jgi:hypothetical protein